jgi:protein-tyrosine phosphatase
MKTMIITFLLGLSQSLFAGLESPIPGTVENLSIPNSHYVYEDLIIRGQTPRNQDEFQQLKDLDVTSVLIFKNETKGEVQSEIVLLNKLKIASKHIEYPWKDITDFKSVCLKTVEALTFLKNNIDENRKTYFHCTVGEDRTGVLAGLLVQMTEKESNVQSIFKHEMCERGYEAGDPKKIYNVVKTVRENLTPVYLKMSYLLSKNKNQLDKINCGYDFSKDAAFSKSFYSNPSILKCSR